MKFFKSILAIAILAFGLCFVGCDNAEQMEETEVKQINIEQEQEKKQTQVVKEVKETEVEYVQIPEEERGVVYYADAVVSYTETFEEGTTVVCKDKWGEHYAFCGEGFEAGDRVHLKLNDCNTENDIYDDIIEDVRVY